MCWDSGGTCFSTQNGHDERASPEKTRRDVLRRDLLVRSVGAILRLTAGTTSVPLRKKPGGTCLSGPCFGTWEGPACQVRIAERYNFPASSEAWSKNREKTAPQREKTSTFPHILRGIRVPAPLQVPSCTPYENNAKGSVQNKLESLLRELPRGELLRTLRTPRRFWHPRPALCGG